MKQEELAEPRTSQRKTLTLFRSSLSSSSVREEAAIPISVLWLAETLVIMIRCCLLDTEMGSKEARRSTPEQGSREARKSAQPSKEARSKVGTTEPPIEGISAIEKKCLLVSR
jgi:hypothetical protein